MKKLTNQEESLAKIKNLAAKDLTLINILRVLHFFLRISAEESIIYIKSFIVILNKFW